MKKVLQKSGKEMFAMLKNVFSIIQIAGFIYAFLCVLYWFLKLAQADFITPFKWLFEPLFSFVKIFYTQKTIPIEQVDLAGIIVSIIFILIAVGAHVAKQFIEKKEELFNIKLQREKVQDDIRAQMQIEREYIAEMKKYNRFIILVDFSIHQIKSYLFDDNVDEDELRGLKISLMAELFNSIKGSYITHKAKYENDSFYVIGNIEKTHECVKMITTAIHELSKKYSDMNITLSHDLSFDAISNKTELNDKLDFLKKVIQLNFNDSTLTTSLFKTCYELISKTHMRFTMLGTFQFLVGGKSSNYELYSVKIINTPKAN